MIELQPDCLDDLVGSTAALTEPTKTDFFLIPYENSTLLSMNSPSFTYDEATGSFTLDGKVVCRGYYGTTTVTDDQLDRVSMVTGTINDKTWTVSVANNGTSVRIFSISRITWSNMANRPAYWKCDAERVYFMATFRNIDGHNRNWGTKKSTFGKMFESIVGEQGINGILSMTSGDLCLSFFIRHPDNDLYDEVKTPQVILTIGWNSATNEYVCPFEMDVKPVDVDLPDRVTGNVELVDGRPLLVTIYHRDGSITSCKYITQHDEYLRRFRCRTHNRFASLFTVEQLCLHHEVKDPTLRAEFDVAIKQFTDQELEAYCLAVAAGRQRLFDDIRHKMNGAYVVFPQKLYVLCKIKETMSRGTSVEEVCTRVHNNLVGVVGGPVVAAVEDFFRHYCRMTIE